MSFEKLMESVERIKTLNCMMTLVNWDQSTELPKNGYVAVEKMVSYLSNLLYQEYVKPELKALLISSDKIDGLNDAQKAIIRDLRKTIDDLEKIPAKEYENYQVLLVKSSRLWEKAKKESDFNIVKDVLKEIINYQKKFAGYSFKNHKTLYDVVLENYEKDFDTEKLDAFFEKLKKEIVPIVKKYQKTLVVKPYNKSVPIEAQEKFNRFVAKYLGFDFDSGVIKTSEHPFTTSIYNKDVRITTHYYPDLLESAIFSTIHETGHALYEQNIADSISYTNIGTGASMGVHESQSRIYENNIGRNRNFWIPIFEKMLKMYDLEMDFDEFISYINQAYPSLIRTEADELTYPLHIMIRYEMEKQIFNEDLEVEKLPELWNKLYKDYLGIEVKNDSEGILQDVHWYSGLFGYFPSYAIGSAFAAQLYALMNKEFDLDKVLREQQLDKIEDYLKEHIHQYGATYSLEELSKKINGESFNVQYYIDYLKSKY